MERRRAIWQKLSGQWYLDMLDSLTTSISLDQVSRAIDDMMAAKIRGRVVVDLDGETV